MVASRGTGEAGRIRRANDFKRADVRRATGIQLYHSLGGKRGLYPKANSWAFCFCPSFVFSCVRAEISTVGRKLTPQSSPQLADFLLFYGNHKV